MLCFPLYGPPQRAPDEVHLTQLEFIRKRNIERNNAKVAGLGIPDAATALAALCEPEPCKPKRKHTSAAAVVAPFRDYNLRDRTRPNLQHLIPAATTEQSSSVSVDDSNWSDQASMSDEVRSCHRGS